MLTAREVADRLGVSAATVLRWTRQGILPGFRLPGGALRYDDDAIGQWIEARSTVGPSVYDALARRLEGPPNPNERLRKTMER